MTNSKPSNSLHPSDLPIDELLSHCRVTRTRGSGPGGQHRNKVETAIVIEFLHEGVLGQASEKRSQEKNREVAIQRLRTNLAIKIRSTRTEISPLWKTRTAQGKLKINVGHADYPSMLAHALDFVWNLDFDIPQAAAELGTTTSQLCKFLKTCPAAFENVNRRRIAQGDKPFK